MTLNDQHVVDVDTDQLTVGSARCSGQGARQRIFALLRMVSSPRLLSLSVARCVWIRPGGEGRDGEAEVWGLGFGVARGEVRPSYVVGFTRRHPILDCSRYLEDCNVAAGLESTGSGVGSWNKLHRKKETSTP